MNTKIFFAALLSLALFTECNFQKIGRDTGKGFNENAQSIAQNLLRGVNDGLSDPAFQKNLQHLVDSLVATAGSSGNKAAKNLLDSLLSDKLVAYAQRLVDSATGQTLRDSTLR